MPNTLTPREIIQRHKANCDRLTAIANACEAENRERTEEEQREFETITRDNNILQMRMAASAAGPAAAQRSLTTQAREVLAGNQQVQLVMRREATDFLASSDLDGTGIIPVQEQEMLTPLRAGLIWDKVGITVRSGLAGGSLRWPSHTKAVAQFAEEGERLTDNKVAFNKLTVAPKRLGIAIPVTTKSIKDSAGVVEDVVRAEMPMAIADLINGAMFATSKEFTGADNQTHTREVYGPFVDCAKINFAAEVPTRAELLKLKAKVLGSGIKVIAPCWVMTESMKAELENKPVDAGSGRFVCENDTILGYPVFTTNDIVAGAVGFGDWSYQAAGFFGDMFITIDPYTMARNGAVDFVLNAEFATVTLRPEAFALGKKA